MTISTLKSLFPATQHHLVTPGALLIDLFPCQIMREAGLPNLLECELGIAEIPEREVLGWRTVADVMGSVEVRLPEEKLASRLLDGVGHNGMPGGRHG